MRWYNLSKPKWWSLKTQAVRYEQAITLPGSREEQTHSVLKRGPKGATNLKLSAFRLFLDLLVSMVCISLNYSPFIVIFSRSILESLLHLLKLSELSPRLSPVFFYGFKACIDGLCSSISEVVMASSWKSLMSAPCTFFWSINLEEAPRQKRSSISLNCFSIFWLFLIDYKAVNEGALYYLFSINKNHERIGSYLSSPKHVI